jgi:hypothetical protein
MGRVRQRCQWPTAARLARSTTGRVAQGEWGRKAVRRKGGSHGTRNGGLRPASACWPSAATARSTRECRRGRRSGAPGSKPVQPACFDQDFAPKI